MATNTQTNSPLVRPDSRPLLVSLLGGGWVVMGCFGLLNALVLMIGIAEGVQFGAQDTEARLAAAAPEFVDESVHQRIALEAERKAVGGRLGIPLFLVAGLAVVGGLRLLQRDSWSRTTLLVSGFGAIAVSSFYAYRLQELTMSSAPAGFAIPPEFETALVATAGFQILIQSLPVILGMSFLRHPVVRSYLQRPRRPMSSPAS